MSNGQQAKVNFPPRAAYADRHEFSRRWPWGQWVLSFPKRLRYFLHRDPALVGRVLAVALRALEGQLCARCPGAPVTARFGAVTFIQRFGSALNAHLHFHITGAVATEEVADATLLLPTT